jgi:hypothetical protein
MDDDKLSYDHPYLLDEKPRMKCNRNSLKSDGSSRAFTLLVTISLMVLLVLVALAMLSLSTLSLRGSNQGAAASLAKSNARLALMLAIGDLQKTLGSDRVITAKASVVHANAGQPHMLGAWQGFGWKTGDVAPPDSAAKESKFLRWLGSSRELIPRTNLDYAASPVIADSVFLSNSAHTGVLPGVNPEVKAERVPILAGDQSGGYAYAISDESMKTPLNLEDSSSLDRSVKYAHLTAAPAPSPGVLNNLLDLKSPPRVVSLATAEIDFGEDKTQLHARRQELSAGSYGLLTNPVTGGFKIDLTPLMEAGPNVSVAEVTGSVTPYFTANDAAPSWNYLRSYYQLYERAVNAGGPKFVLNAQSPELAVGTLGQKAIPAKAVLLPVIAKLQIMFSMVSHYHHIRGRVQYYETEAVPKGLTNHAVPHLVYEPIITLYNPYDVQLEFPSLRVRMADPPVGFQLQKHDLQKGTNPFYRQEFGKGEFHSMARFQIANEKNVNARRFFTYQLKGKSGSAGEPGGTIKLLPGEVKVYSAYVEKDWSWGMETRSEWHPRAFFDWNVGTNMGNVDRRTQNVFGVDAVAGLDFRAGLQADHMSYVNGRPIESRYDYEIATNVADGYLSMRITDDVTVNARVQRCVPDDPNLANIPDYQVDLLGGVNETAQNDMLRSYEFRFKDIAAELGNKVITRRFKNADILQKPPDMTPGGKSPFAILTMTAKTTRDTKDDSKSWLHNNFSIEGAMQNTAKIGNAAQSYDLRFQEITSYNSFPGVEIDPATDRGFFGAKPTSADGVSVVPMYRVPVQPAASLGDWIAANLCTSSQYPRVNYPLGNSFAHPMIPSKNIASTSPINGAQKMLDHSYLMNAALWDNCYFSSATDYNAPMIAAKRSRNQVLLDFFRLAKPLLNNRLAPILGEESATQLATRVAAMSPKDQARQFGRYAMIKSPFNVNTDSVSVWRTILSSLRDYGVAGWNNTTFGNAYKTPYPRFGTPVVGSSDDANPNNTVNALGQMRWAGYRTLTDPQIEALATKIVEEIRLRAKTDKAPCLSLADFINRRVGNPGELHALKGILQTAIDNSGVNAANHLKDSKNNIVPPPERRVGVPNTDALLGKTADGAPSILTQGDLLTALAPIISVRGDTFTVRAYGEARSSDGGTVLAKAWCEATVQRTVQYLDPANAPQDKDFSTSPIGNQGLKDLTPTNKWFGRRFVVTAFRWLAPSDV